MAEAERFSERTTRDPLAQLRRLARNEKTYGDALVARQAGELDASEVTRRFACECARTLCEDPTVELSVTEYEMIRRSPSRFVVAPFRKYVHSPLETIVEENDRYFVVERTAA